MSDFTLPTNIKQIGTIGEGLRIYVEDYVCTYLFQYAEAGGYDERIALLVGRFMVIDGQSVLFINGAVQGKYAEEKDGLIHFTEKDLAYADAMISEFFEGMEIVGWMQSQPSYGVYLNQQYAAYHLREFARDHQVMFVTDPLERINVFYSRGADRDSLAEVKGYFIYYDKNRNMHDYMLKDKASDFKTQPPSYIELTRMERVEDTDGEDRDGDARPEEVIRRHQAERVRKRSTYQQKRTMNLMISLSAVLFVVCFVMGAGLIQNQDRITKMEDELVRLSTAYKNLFVQMNDGTAAVFAAQSDEEKAVPPEETAEPAAQVIEENGVAATPQPDPTQSLNEPAQPETPVVATAATEPAVIETVPVSASASASAPETYTIQPGDSLIAISVRFYGDKSRVDDILSLNGIENADRIVAGKTIALPRP